MFVFVQLGLQRYHGVGILGFNSAEWFISDIAAILAGWVSSSLWMCKRWAQCSLTQLWYGGYAHINTVVWSKTWNVSSAEPSHVNQFIINGFQHNNKQKADGLHCWTAARYIHLTLVWQFICCKCSYPHVCLYMCDIHITSIYKDFSTSST